MTSYSLTDYLKQTEWFGSCMVNLINMNELSIESWNELNLFVMITTIRLTRNATEEKKRQFY